MKPSIYIRGLIVLLLLGPTSGCLILEGSGTESGTIADMVPLNPDAYSCSPLDEGQTELPPSYGVYGQLYYLTPSQPRYTSVVDYFTNGTQVSDLELFLNQVYIPTRPFDRGFVTAAGTTITNEQGDTLYEYFAMNLRGRLARGSLPPGRYQMALLSDDGSILSMDTGSGMVQVVNNDGQHPTRMGCAMTAIELGDAPIPYELLYNQGPRFHIALTWMIRPWPADENPNDVQCGLQGNAMYFDSTQDPPAPQPAYNNLLARGWMPLAPENYLLPLDKVKNPCAVQAPVISNVVVSSILSTSVTLTWDTDIGSTSQVLYRPSAGSVFSATSEVNGNSVHHMVTVTGLLPNTNYNLKAVSKSFSGQSSESAELAVRTRR